MLALAWYVVLALVGTAVVWTASDWLETSADRLSAYYGLPAIVQGALVVAVASSFPELTTAVVAPLIHGEFDLGVGAIIGSAIFNVLVIPGLATTFSPGALNVNRDVVYKEAQFYFVSIAVFLLMCSFAVIYYPVENGVSGTITPVLAAIPIGTYLLYLFIQYEDTIEHDAPDVSGIAPATQWAYMLVSLAAILFGVEALVRAAIGFGNAFGTPSFVWGLTVVAAATSLPDAFVSVTAAKRDHDVTSIANVLGSNVFDLLVAVPAGVIVASAVTTEAVAVDFAVVVPLIAVLVLATVALFAFLRTDLELASWEPWTLLGLYLAFLLWLTLESLGLTGVLV
ncbi:sodium:calcium antiporter [Halalkalicoccus jeotgali]|uniref:Na+/Ca2+-antiporter n=1 Tax=Halalkalicoccus jeotgali (strain DSM 18796 / CECT 7217 / JCM 14584 / KCTC 4019 / B3) TaxID=795797 RepID=D8JA60_HALJB|nr:sodium:calcium antiporter [Halalkalicoccus jeotgali]ADJ14582.1 Na+/Ca2+-antiporter [Halalkalicoccus jeotgali B3]ELY39954.1 Na+/Ca2+-antiporter [Halalkalicoccus jeotgali B3]